ncbi:FecR family protein [Tamlana sp. 2201CG12-4]|uniref:FecR family protein n=1 Tax=Tamlana sp. 2201CG12-4 TaxID=3112582 RepID=UPI002DB7790F|nr:FecR family protein [Tamlana sp. 2201CG12-4]MEC3908496.1 FecR family protein [Tamlana sp. 2201CG12-4]
MPSYALEDYLTDDSFIQWVLQPNKELDIKWSKFIKENAQEKAKIDQAKELLRTIHSQTISEYDHEIDDEKLNNIWMHIEQSLQKSKSQSVKKISYPILKIAASIILLLGIAYFYQQGFFSGRATPTVVDTNVITPGVDKATLTLEDGSVIELDKGNTYQAQNVNSNGEQIVYTDKEQNTTEIKYNYLTIPRGGQFFIKLSDGTQIWLNSESQLKYPVNFIKGQTRQVELVYGEAYFDVSPSTEHHGDKFKVLNQSQEIEVLGTEFNVKAYKDETNIYTTLVEGHVVIDNGNTKHDLLPDQQSNLNTQNNTIAIAKVDVNPEISWKNGIFSFKEKSLKEIMKVISRWYDIDVVFENKELESIKFKGILDKQQGIDRILSIMKSSTINNYEIKDKTIILK